MAILPKLLLPVLTTEVDCEAFGYPDIVVTLRLNLPYCDEKFPWEQVADRAESEALRKRILAETPWASDYYFGLARMVVSITLGPQYVEGAEEPLTIRVHEDPKALYELLFTPGFDQEIINYALGVYERERQERLKAALGN